MLFLLDLFLITETIVCIMFPDSVIAKYLILLSESNVLQCPATNKWFRVRGNLIKYNVVSISEQLVCSRAPVAIREFVSSACTTNAPPWTITARVVLAAITKLPVSADRAAALDALDDCFLRPVLFVDDLTAPCSSSGAASGLCSQAPSSACSVYARKVKADFRHGPWEDGHNANVPGP